MKEQIESFATINLRGVSNKANVVLYSVLCPDLETSWDGRDIVYVFFNIWGSTIMLFNSTFNCTRVIFFWRN